MEIFVSKENQQHGPYDQEQLLTLLNDGKLTRRDLIFYDGLGEWKPLEEVFEVEEALMHYMDEGQDAEVVAEVYQQVTQIISSHEQIFYIAHQKRKLMKTKPDAVIVTNERLIIIHQGLGGSRVEDHQWKDIIRVEMKEGLMGTTFSMLDRNDHIIQVDDLPKPQLEKLYLFSQEMRS
ncbi:MAG: PH domain-containing protein [Verrucomicrobiota bacterium]